MRPLPICPWVPCQHKLHQGTQPLPSTFPNTHLTTLSTQLPLLEPSEDVAPPEDVDNARAVVNRFAARAQQQAQHAAEGGAAAWRTAQAHAQGRGGGSPQPDDGSWLDEPTEVKGQWWGLVGVHLSVIGLCCVCRTCVCRSCCEG